MEHLGHWHDAQGNSRFRVYAPGKKSVAVALLDPPGLLPLAPEGPGHWSGSTARLPEGTRYLIEVDGQRWPDIASRSQPDGVHAPSAVAAPRPVASPGWTGVAMADAVIYELHVGTFTPEGTLAAALGRLEYLRDLGITVVELMPLAAFPGTRNWGYDGVYLFALQSNYGSWNDLADFIEHAHALGMAVVLDVVYNHFGPEGNYSANFAPYTKAAATPWGAAVNVDGPWSHGVREFFLENLRFWIEDVGFDGVRMDAVSMIFDNLHLPTNILRDFTDLARGLGTKLGRTVLTIAEHLRNSSHVTSPQGFHYDSQWNDDINHALFSFLTGETRRHYANFRGFGDVVTALRDGFVMDGTRFDHHNLIYTGTDGRGTHGSEHVVHIQDHDQVGNRLHGDRMIATYGREKALLAITAVFASPFVPMLWMGEEYGERAPFLFFEDFGDRQVIDGVRAGRKAEYAFGGQEPPDPHAESTFEASRLRWEQLESKEGAFILAFYRQLIALKRSGALGPRERAQVAFAADAQQELLRVETPATLTVLNFSGSARSVDAGPGWVPSLSTSVTPFHGQLPAYAAVIFRKRGET